MEKEIWFKLKYKWYRLTHWEFWPIWAIYFPCIFYYIWISIKSKSFGFFKAVNPAIIHGGMTLEDKNFINQLIPQKYRALSFLINKNTDFKRAKNILKNNLLQYPIILKPNNGCRGRNVKLINNEDQFKNYLKNFGNEEILLEEYIDFPNEIGVFYIRIPTEEKGFISGIVQKKGIEVVGNGNQNLGKLIKGDYRYHKYYPAVFENSRFKENYIPKDNEKILLSNIGNHALGATFYDASDKISPELTELFNSISLSIKGFYYGRFDVKFNTWEDLKIGKDFKIIELNGAASEPTHIYDSSHSYFFAIKEIIKHWDYMYQISRINKKLGHFFTNIEESWILFKEFNPFIER